MTSTDLNLLDFLTQSSSTFCAASTSGILTSSSLRCCIEDSSPSSCYGLLKLLLTDVSYVQKVSVDIESLGLAYSL